MRSAKKRVAGKPASEKAGFFVQITSLFTTEDTESTEEPVAVS